MLGPGSIEVRLALRGLEIMNFCCVKVGGERTELGRRKVGWREDWAQDGVDTVADSADESYIHSELQGPTWVS